MSSPVSTGMGWLSSGGYMYTISVYNQPTRSTQSCIPPALLNQVPGKGGNVTTVGWQVTLCDPIWHVSSHRIEDSCNAVYFAVVSPEDVDSLGSLVPAHPGSPRQRAVKQLRICVCLLCCSFTWRCWWSWLPVDLTIGRHSGRRNNLRRCRWHCSDECSSPLPDHQQSTATAFVLTHHWIYTGRRHLCWVCTPHINSQRLRHSQPETESRRTCIFCGGTVCLEPSTDTADLKLFC